MMSKKPTTEKKKPQVKIYFSDNEARAVQGAIDIMAQANGEPITPKEFAKWAVMTMVEGVGQKAAEVKAANSNLVVSDESFDDMMSHEDDEPTESLKELMSKDSEDNHG